MIYLLDTHVLYWIAVKPNELGKNARRLIARAHQVWFSSLSPAELLIKQDKGKFTHAQDIALVMEGEAIRELPFTKKHAFELPRFGALNKHDPFDRMILSQAAAENLTLITADQTLLALGLPWVMDATV